MRPLWLRLCLVIPALFFTAGIVYGEDQPEITEITWTNTALKSAEIPYESANHLVLLPVRVNGSELLWFVLDSGSSYCFINLNRARSLGLEFESEAQASGAGSGTQSVQVIKGAVDFGFDAFKVSIAPAGAMDLTSLEPVIGHAVDGILGYDIFQKLVITADYGRRRLTFADPATFHSAPGTQYLPLTFQDRVPLVQGRIAIPGKPSTIAKFMVDSGSGDAVDHPLIKRSSGKLLNTITGVGIGNEMRGVVGRIDSLKLGPFKLRGAVSACCGGSDLSSQLIGGQALSRFTVIFDYSHQRLGLKPNRSYHDPFPADQSGLVLRLDPITKNFVVHGLVENSPATDAGLQAGDIIVAVDGVSSSEIGLDKVKEIFAAKSGKHDLTIHDLTVERGAKRLTIHLRLRSLL
jgi:hypothetical protein